MDEWMVGWEEDKKMMELNGWMVELLGGGALNWLAVPSCHRRPADGYASSAMTQ